MDEGLQAFYEHPFGSGLYPTGQPGINLVASLGSIGIIGLILFIYLIVVAGINSPRPLRKLIYISPFVITAVTSQPLLDAPLMFIFFLFDFDLAPARASPALPRSRGELRFPGRDNRADNSLSRFE